VEGIEMRRKIAISAILIFISILGVNIATQQNLVVGQLPPEISMGVANNTTSTADYLNYGYLTLEAQKSFWGFLNQVAGVTTYGYNVTRFHISPVQAPGSQKLQIAISAIISKDSENISISMELTEGKITFYKLELISGSLQGLQLDSNTILSKAKNAIAEYRANFNAPYCTGLDQLVPSSMKANDFTIDSNDTLLNVQLSTDQRNPIQFAHLVWYAKVGNSTINSQSIQIEVAKTGILTEFVDNLGLYKLATNTIAITKDAAVTSANKIIDSFATANGLRIESMESQLSYVPDINGTRGDCFSVYPLWQISAKFDESQKVANGYSVCLWADSGKVRNQGPEIQQVKQQPVLETTPSNPSLANISAMVAFGLVGITICIKNAGKLKGKRGIIKIFGATFLISIVCSLTATQPSIAFPSSIYAETWDSNTPVPHQFPENELNLMSQLTIDIASWSNEIGYTPYNYYGEDTNSGNLYLGASDHGDSASLVFYIGHGGTNPYRIANDDGSSTSASDILDNSQQHGWSKFAFIDSCDQGDGMGSGSMAEAWLHTTSESSDGYHYSDNSMNCYISWIHEGPWQSNTVNDIENAPYWFEFNFYAYSMLRGYSINAALDKASLANWQADFDDGPFHNGWIDYVYDHFRQSSLAVYGQGSMFIGLESYGDSWLMMDAGYSGNACVLDPNNVLGTENDGSYTGLIAPAYGDFAYISVQLNQDSDNNDIYLWGYSDSATSHLTVYVSWDLYNWDQIYYGSVQSGDGVHSISCGTWSGVIRHVLIAVQNDDGNPSRMYIDALHVAHP
jgi:hypothetical protein